MMAGPMWLRLLEAFPGLLFTPRDGIGGVGEQLPVLAGVTLLARWTRG